MGVPHPAENPHWPSWFYPPDTDPEDPAKHGRVFFKAEDVPEGWAVDWRLHGANLNRPPPEAPQATLTRSELKLELDKRDVAYPPNAAKAELQRLLDEAEADEALEAGV